jgi:hypothetical protein
VGRANRRHEPLIVEKVEAVSVLKSLYYERVRPGVHAALVRSGDVRLPDVDRRQHEHEICAGWSRGQGPSMRDRNARA